MKEWIVYRKTMILFGILKINHYICNTIKEKIMNKINELKKLDKHQLQSISITSTGGFFNNSESKKTILNYLIRNIDRVKDEHIQEAMDIYTTPI